MSNKISRIRQMLEVLNQNGFTLTDLADLLDCTERVLNQPPVVPSSQDNKDLDLKVHVTKIMHNIGIPANISGYNYIREAIILVYNNPVIYKKSINLYSELAKMFETTPSRVERSIRYSIENTWYNAKNLEYINFKNRPTAKEFIFAIVDYLRIS